MATSEVLDAISHREVGHMTPQQIENKLEYLLKLKSENRKTWIKEYLCKTSLLKFLESVVDSKLPVTNLECIKGLMQQLITVDKESSVQLGTRLFAKISKWLNNIVDFQSFDAFLEKLLEEEGIAQSNERGSLLKGSKKIYKNFANAIRSLQSCYQNSYYGVLIAILVYPFQNHTSDDVVNLQHCTLNDLQNLRKLFSQKESEFNDLVENKDPLHRQIYLFNLAIDHCRKTERKELQYFFQKIKQMMNSLEPPLEKKILAELNEFLQGSSSSHFKQKLQQMSIPIHHRRRTPHRTRVVHHPSPNSLMKVLKTSTHKQKMSSEDQSSVFEENSDAYDLLEGLGLCKYYPKKLQLQDAVCIRAEPLNLSLNKTKSAVHDHKQLPFLVLHKIMAYDSLCRSDLMPPSRVNKHDDFQDDAPIGGIHPVDVLLALFICSDDFLCQDLLSRLAKCQLSVPFILPDPFTKQLTIPLWAMRSIIKEWKCTDEDNKIVQQTHPIVSYEMPVVPFICIGKSQKHSKSKILNEVISGYDHFFHHDCPGGEHNRLLGEGLVDVCWYLPDGNVDDAFNHPVTFLNLHGDARQHPQQIKLLSQISSTCLVLLSDEKLESDGQTVEILESFSSSPGGIIVLAEKNPTTLKGILKQDNMYTVNLTKTLSQIKETIHDRIKSKLSLVKERHTIETAVANMSDSICDNEEERILVDESSDLYEDGLNYAHKIKEIVTGHITGMLSIRDLLPLQGNSLWKAWADNDKELYRQLQRGNKSIDDYNAEIKTKSTKIRREQLKYVKSLTPLMESFIRSLLKLQGPSNKILRNYFLSCLKLELNNISRESMSILQFDYQSTRKALSKVDPQGDEASELKKKLNELQESILNSSFGLEHLLQEVGQVYEAALQSRPRLHLNDLSRLPKAAAELLIDGWPLEVMDGDAAHVPLQWVTAVLLEMEKILGNHKVFVLSVLGLQGTGKSTMLNTVFGLQFNVSAGRCTRGAFMQLLPLDEELRQQTKFSYVLVVDTEGLRAPALDYLKTQKHDNELATFVIGLANMTLINIYGEVPGDMDDILQTSVHAFLRMKEVKCKPSCNFVYQNAVANIKSEAGRAKFLEKLDKLTIEAAKAENCEDKYECFDDVIKFDDHKDVHHFPALWKGEPPMAPVSPGYSKAAQMIKQHIIEILCNKASVSSFTLPSLRGQMNDLWKSLLKEKFVFSFKNIVEIIAYKALETEYSKWDWTFREKMLIWEQKAENEITTTNLRIVLRLVKQKKRDLHDYLSRENERLKLEMETFFKGNQSDILVQWKAKFQNRLASLSYELKVHAENHCIKLEKSMEAISKIESERTQYAEKITRGVQEHISSIKQEQEELGRSLEEGKLKSAQLKKILEKKLFTLENLARSKALTEEQKHRINTIISVQCRGQLDERGLRKIMVGGLLQIEQVKAILKMERQTEEELRRKFGEIWDELISTVPEVPRHFTDVTADIENNLMKLFSTDVVEPQLLEKLKNKPLRQWGTSLELVPEEGIHFQMKGGPFAVVKRAWTQFIRGQERNHSPIVQEITNRIFSEVRQFLKNITDKEYAYSSTFTQKLLLLMDKTFKEKSSASKDDIIFTLEYKLDVFLTVCGYAISEFERMAESYDERSDPVKYLEKHMKGTLFAKFKNQCYQIEAEKAIANTLCASLDGPIKRQLKKTLGAKMVGHMKSSKQYFSSKMALKSKVLIDLHEKDDFESYVAYLFDVKKYFEDWIKHYIIEYCDEVIPGETTRLQIAAKEEVSRFIEIVKNEVIKVDDTVAEKGHFPLSICTFQNLQFCRLNFLQTRTFTNLHFYKLEYLCMHFHIAGTRSIKST